MIELKCFLFVFYVGCISVWGDGLGGFDGILVIFSYVVKDICCLVDFDG